MTRTTDDQETLLSELLDRRLDGESLNETEQATLDRLLDSDPAFQREAELLDCLGELSGPADSSSRALADGALQALHARDVVTPLPTRPTYGWRASSRAAGRVPSPVLWTGAIVAAAAAGVLLMRWPTGAPAIGTDAVAMDPMKPAPATPGVEDARVELVYLSGEAQLQRDGSDHMSTARDAHGQLLAQGDALEVASGSACFVLDPGINVCLDAHSRLRIDQLLGRKRLFVLERGRVSLQLAHQPRGFSVAIEAQGVISTAVGTTFSVQRAAGRVRTTVLEGRVEVTAANQTRLIGAHHRLTVDKEQLKSTRLSRSQEAPEWNVIRPARLWEGRAAAVLAVSGQPSGADVWLDDQRLGRTPLSTLVPAGRHEVTVTLNGKSLAAETMVMEPGQQRTLAYALAPAKLQERQQLQERASPADAVTKAVHGPAPQTTGPAPDLRVPGHATRRGRSAHGPRAGYVPGPEELLSEAHRLMVRKRYNQAAQTYEALRQVHGDAPEARTVLIALARLELHHRDDPRRAAALAGRYLSEGGGDLNQEARHLRILSLRARHRPAAERQAIVDFLDRHPGSMHTAQLRSRLTILTNAGGQSNTAVEAQR